jgi:hypothetical protein
MSHRGISHRGIRIGIAILASMLAFAIGTGAQARGGGGHGGGHFGGGHFGGGHFGGFHFGGHGFHLGGRGFHFGGHRFAHGGFGHHHFGGRSFAARHGMRAAAALGAGHFAHNHFAHDNFHNFRGGYGYGYGWYGPVFWPYAYDDIFDDILWGFGLGGPFWGYGYGDVYGGLFSPYGYNDLAGYLPGGQSQGATSSRTNRRTQSRQAAVSSQLSQMCGDDSKEVAGWPIDRIEQSVSPTPEQSAALDEFANATIRAAQTIKDACPTNVVLTAAGRLDAMGKRIEGMARAVDTVGPPLDRFYSTLTDEQKARLNAANEQDGRNRGALASCGAVGNATRWPGDQIEKAVRPDPEQQTKLDALKAAMAEAADDLANACPSALPATPPARLKAISMRLDAMQQTLKNVRAALDDFYNALSDEQKAQFNMIGRQQTARR